jgi:hypothetical protein
LPQQEYWSFRDHKERVTEVEVSPGAGQWPGEIMIKRLARYAPNDYFICSREREDREAGSPVQEENDLFFFYYYGYPRLLNIDFKKWSLDRKLQDPSIHRRWHPTFCLEKGHLDLQWLLLQRAQGLSGGWGCLPGCPLFGHSLWKCPSCPQW